MCDFEDDSEYFEDDFSFGYVYFDDDSDFFGYEYF